MSEPLGQAQFLSKMAAAIEGKYAQERYSKTRISHPWITIFKKFKNFHDLCYKHNFYDIICFMVDFLLKKNGIPPSPKTIKNSGEN